MMGVYDSTGPLHSKDGCLYVEDGFLHMHFNCKNEGWVHIGFSPEEAHKFKEIFLLKLEELDKEVSEKSNVVWLNKRDGKEE